LDKNLRKSVHHPQVERKAKPSRFEVQQERNGEWAYKFSREVSFVKLEGIEPENSLDCNCLLKWKDVNARKTESDATCGRESE